MTIFKKTSRTLPTLVGKVVIILSLSFAPMSWASIYLNGTRLIIAGNPQEASLRVSNESKQPVLLQTWVDRGEMAALPENISVPFVITPPITRLEGHKTQLLRVMFTGNTHSVPADRESVYWLNVLEIPPKPTADTSTNKVQLAFRTRIKLFYRPQQLSSMDFSHVTEKLRFSLFGDNNQKALRVENPTPLNQTLLSVSIGRDINHAVVTFIPEEDMVSPFSTKVYPLEHNKGAFDNTMKVFFSSINDYGVIIQSEKPLEH